MSLWGDALREGLSSQPDTCYESNEVWCWTHDRLLEACRVEAALRVLRDGIAAEISEYTVLYGSSGATVAARWVAGLGERVRDLLGKDKTNGDA